VIVLCGTVILQRENFCDNRGIKNFLTVNIGNDLFGQFSLLWLGKVNATAVLRTPVIALPIQGGGVVNHKENFQQDPGADDLRVVYQPYHLVVTRLT
jgi:hypothetical protein